MQVSLFYCYHAGGFVGACLYLASRSTVGAARCVVAPQRAVAAVWGPVGPAYWSVGSLPVGSLPARWAVRSAGRVSSSKLAQPCA